ERVENPFAVDPFQWLRDLVERLEKGDEPAEFLENVKLDMFNDQVFCFTPNGDVVGLPRGATPIDFAYAIHTRVGDRCAGAVVDGNRVPLWTRLRNGQQVEIITAEGQRPSPQWEELAKTGRAKSAIRRTVRERLRAEQVALGRDLVFQGFARAGRTAGEKTLATAAARLGIQDVSDMLIALSEGRIASHAIIEAVYPNQSGQPSETLAAVPEIRVRGIKRGQAISFCKTCWPIPGDRIMGLMRRGKVIVHAIACPLLAEFEDELERWHDLGWDPEANAQPVNLVRISLTLANQPGTLGAVCTLVGEAQANIDNIGVSTRKPDFFVMDMELEVRDVKHLGDILASLRAQDYVNHVERAFGSTEIETRPPGVEQPRLPLGRQPVHGA
ncbi:MAG: RelA/SpoT AH/RIS domain-containing protein, partial [Pseudomonadota bacterium]